MTKKHKAQPVTRREVLRIVQRARDEILAAIIHAQPGTVASRITWPAPGYHFADVEPKEEAG